MFGCQRPGWSARILPAAGRGRAGPSDAGRKAPVSPRAMRSAACLALALLLGLSGRMPAAHAQAGAPSAAAWPAAVVANASTRLPPSAYFAATPQLTPLRPLAHLPPQTKARIHALVVTAPDPVETRLGRSFDMEIAALLTAFQARSYVLDAFAFAWRPRDAAPRAGAKGDADFHRGAPSVLLFRRDNWRKGSGVEYYVLFLVGDSQTFGVEPVSFRTASRCALLLNDIGNGELNDVRDVDCDVARPQRRQQRLYVIGPSFSGSMQSMAIALANLCEGPCGEETRRVVLLSPSASVGSNNRIGTHPFLSPLHGHKAAFVDYHPLARNLSEQIAGLVDYLCGQGRLPHGRVAILAEESTFGKDALEFDASHTRCAEKIRVSTRQFPPNIASIRAEHSQLRDARRSRAMAMIPATGRLLELDLGGTEISRERPIVYQPSLSSRSDELMLYRVFDTMRLWNRPDLVVIVATDIRDRLFLLGEVRKSLPEALPAMVELDFLAVHPDYRKVSRGAAVLAAGEPLACLDGDGTLVACFRREPERDGRRPGRLTYFPFATDYAANMFRAVLLIDEYDRRDDGAPFYAFMTGKLQKLDAGGVAEPKAYVATMAGFQGLGGIEAQRSLVAVADARLEMQQPVYLILLAAAVFFVVTAGWMWLGRDHGRVVLPCLRGLVYDFRALGASLSWRWRHRHAPPPGRINVAASRSLAPTQRAAWLGLLAVVGAAGAVVAAHRGLQLMPTSHCAEQRLPCFFQLAHGRDILALACIWMLYACLCLVAYMRLDVSNRRYAFYIGAFARRGGARMKRSRVITGVSWTVPVVCALLLVALVYNIRGNAVSLDNDAVWWWAVIVMATGMGFLVNLLWQLRLLNNLSLPLTRAVTQVRAKRGLAEWPRPAAIRELPQTPFNLALRQYKRDMPALLRWSPRLWARMTRRIMADGGTGGVTPVDDADFDRWSEQLVAELKLGVVTLRTCAWCAMLAPISVLVAMSAYPPVYERLLTSIAIFQLLASFLVTIYVVLRLEQDPMLGPMFTRDGDSLTFGGALRALWPKFVAMGLVLIPLAAPDVWTWMHGLIRSINSFG